MPDEARPRFTVVMAAYQAAATVGAAIDSVLRQSRGDFELIVVDDGSTDGTAAAVEAVEDPRVRLLSQPNGGAAAARNAGIAAGRAPLVCMLDSDDLWLPDYLERMGAALDGAPEAALAFTDAWSMEESGGRFRKATAMERAQPPFGRLSADRFLHEIARRNFVFNAVTVRRQALERAGGYAADLSHAEDWDLWLRIAAAGNGAVGVAGPLAIYRRRPDSLSGDKGAMLNGTREMLRRVAERYEVPDAVKAEARAGLVDVEQQLAALRPPTPAQAALARVKAALRAPLLRRRTPPPEVVAAFPALARRRGRHGGGAARADG